MVRTGEQVGVGDSIQLDNSTILKAEVMYSALDLSGGGQTERGKKADVVKKQRENHHFM